jgi:hypothetical protein
MLLFRVGRGVLRGARNAPPPPKRVSGLAVTGVVFGLGWPAMVFLPHPELAWIAETVWLVPWLLIIVWVWSRPKRPRRRKRKSQPSKMEVLEAEIKKDGYRSSGG